jgi:hypothetical protein
MVATSYQSDNIATTSTKRANTMNFQEMNDFADKMLPHYLQCAAWSTSDTDKDGVDVENLEEFEFSDEARKFAKLDCLYFVRSASYIFEDISASDIGHNLWLTREGHGVGFWDRDFKYKGILSIKAENMGPGSAYLSDANEIEFQ